MKFVAVPEVRPHLLGTLIRLREQHPPGKMFVEPAAKEPDDVVRFRQALARRSLALDQVGHGIHTESIDTEAKPELHDLPHFLADGGVVVVQVRLMAEEPVPVVLSRIPGPVGPLGITRK